MTQHHDAIKADAAIDAGGAAIERLYDPAALAALHACAFERPWSMQSFADLLSKSGVYAFGSPHGFILLQTIWGRNDCDDQLEAEILTLAVHPKARRQGKARALLAFAISHLQAKKLFLEVAQDNQSARALYSAAGFHESGRRKDYYKNADGSRADAILMHAVFSD